jgi:hypothetical protein
MNKDIESICKDIIKVYDMLNNKEELVSNQGQSLDGYSALANFNEYALKLKQLMENQNEL